MDVVISFFRDTLSGWVYFIYLVVCVILILAIVGVLGDKKRSELLAQIKHRKMMDLLSGNAAIRASLEGKQIIDVVSEGTHSIQPSVQAVSNTTPVSQSPSATDVNLTNASINNNNNENNKQNPEEVQPLVINGDSEAK